MTVGLQPHQTTGQMSGQFAHNRDRCATDLFEDGLFSLLPDSVVANVSEEFMPRPAHTDTTHGAASTDIPIIVLDRNESRILKDFQVMVHLSFRVGSYRIGTNVPTMRRFVSFYDEQQLANQIHISFHDTRTIATAFLSGRETVTA